MALKEMRDKALAKKTQAAKVVTPQKPKTDKPKPQQPDPVAVATLQTLQQTLAQQAQLITGLASLVERQGKQLETLMKRPIEVSAGDVEVNMPEPPRKPTSFTCEFDDGRTATLTPNYGSVN